jgi:hypothetical protein
MNALFQSNASDARYHRASGRSISCPCKTPEGFRDPQFHLSFGMYGAADWTISPGVIPAGTVVKYMLVAFNSQGTAMYPAITTPDITDPANFQVVLHINWPPNFVRFDIYRYENGVGPYTFGAVSYGTNQVTDNTSLHAAGTPPSPYTPPVLCNEAGEIPNPVDISVKAFCQPIQSTRATRLSTEYLQEVFGTIEADDHLGIFPVVWASVRLDFRDWSQHGDDFIEYDSQRFFVVNANMIPDPGDGNPEHHWEVGMRVIRSDGLS